MATEDSPAKQDTNRFPAFNTKFLVISIINAITITAKNPPSTQAQ